MEQALIKGFGLALLVAGAHFATPTPAMALPSGGQLACAAANCTGLTTGEDLVQEVRRGGRGGFRGGGFRGGGFRHGGFRGSRQFRHSFRGGRSFRHGLRGGRHFRHGGFRRGGFGHGGFHGGHFGFSFGLSHCRYPYYYAYPYGCIYPY